ncbi:IS3 family transposase [Streptomyces sp. NPDC059454]|uniref:IS3 family transposase n=1 Tax=Streptomyces sp. NPDC059454 TaxID=3346836 RepID=UPI0036762F4F
MLVYPSGLDLSSSALRFLAGKLTVLRRERGTRWRRLGTDRQALLVLAHLRCGHTYAQLAAGFGISVSTICRYVSEAVELLAALAPGLAEAVRAASRKAFVILDGTLLPIDRIAADRPFYSGKHKKHGMNVQVLTDPAGRLLWASPALPGAVHDIRAAREHGITGAVRGKRVITTLPGGQAGRAPDLVDRDFVAGAPNRCWAADFTHVKTWAGVVYVAFVVDTFSRRIVGWSAATVKETVFVPDALEMAIWQRDRDQHPVQPGELIHHSDAGSQYTSFRLAEHLDVAGIAASIGSVGDAYDNALMESTIGLFKTELIKPRRPWKTLSDVELATAEYVDWYNHRRLHGEIGHVPPVEYENNHYLTTTKLRTLRDLYRTRNGSDVHPADTSPRSPRHARARSDGLSPTSPPCRPGCSPARSARSEAELPHRNEDGATMDTSTTARTPGTPRACPPVTATHRKTPRSPTESSSAHVGECELGHDPKAEELEPQSANRHSQRGAGGQSAPHKPVCRKRDDCDKEEQDYRKGHIHLYGRIAACR